MNKNKWSKDSEYRSVLTWRRINVFVNAIGYYSGEGYLTSIKKDKSSVCVTFPSKGSVWFNRSKVLPIKESITL